MTDKAKELNRVINRMYRQLGKDLYEDLKRERVSVKNYRKQSRRIDNVIKALQALEIQMDNIEDEDMKVVMPPEQDEEGLFHYKFCKACNAGNNPEATHCLRCGEKL